MEYFLKSSLGTVHFNDQIFICIYILPNPFATSKIWHKVNFMPSTAGFISELSFF